MAYSDVGIVNIGLGEIGVQSIASLTEDSPVAIYVNSVYEYIRDEVLQSANWNFAKTRYKLAKNTTSPLYSFDYAYTLPADFLRLDYNDPDDPVVYPVGTYGANDRVYIYNGTLIINNLKYIYRIETLPDGTLCLVTDYDNSDQDIYIRYIRRETNPGKYSPLFANALAYRIAQRCAVKFKESLPTRNLMREEYMNALREAKAVNVSGDYVEAELGSKDWENAGR